MTRLALLALVACGSPTPSPPARVPPPPPDAAEAPIDAPERPRPKPMSDQALKDHQAQLGASATTCFGTAQLLAAQGTVAPAKLEKRRATIQRLCIEDRWPARVRECVATADHDPLSCTAYFTTPRQRARWEPVFEHWVDP